MSFRLPRLPSQARLTGARGEPTRDFTVWWQRLVEAIEAQELLQDSAIADIQRALNLGNGNMPDIADVTITADYAGTVDPASQLPKSIRFTRMDGTDDVSADAVWSVEASAGISCTIDGGIVTLTAITKTGTITATSFHNDITLTRGINVFKTNAATPTGSGGGSSASDSSFASINSTVAAQITGTLTVTAGASGEVQLSAPLSVTTGDSMPAGTFEVEAQWMQGASYVGTAVASDPDCTVTEEFGFYFVSDGAISVSHTVTGLTPGNSYDFTLWAANVSGSREMSFSGTASAVVS